MRWASATAPTVRGPQRGLPQAATAPSDHGARPSRVGAALDFASDWGVLAFASWTLIAYVGMATQARVSLLVPVWLATVPAAGALLLALSRRPRPPGRLDRSRAAGPAPRYRRRLLVASLAAGFVSAIVAGAWENAPWVLVWTGMAFAVAVAVRAGLRSERSATPEPAFGWPAHAYAVVVGFGFAAMSLVITRPNGDDAFFVNRATGTAELNRIPVRDIMFTDERVPAVSGTGLPVETFSALQGALGRFVGIHAASVAYYVTPPLMTFFATWALWRLLRAWAPRNAVLCFSLGCVYWVFSAQSALTPGSFFLNRMWQGKVVFVAWLVLTAYVFLTRWLAQRDALTAVLLVAAAVSAIGLTASAAFVVPLLFAAAAVPLLARREWRGLPLLFAAAAFPLVVGFVAAQQNPLAEIYPDPRGPAAGAAERGSFWSIGTSWYFHEVFGVGVVAAIGVIGLFAAPWLVRSGPAARLTSGIAAVSIVLLAPGVLPALNAVTELTTVLRRTLWVVPLPAVVGLLGAVAVAEVSRRVAGAPVRRRRLAAVAPALLAAALLVGFGHPLWLSWREGVSLWSAPRWKINEYRLDNARAILRHYHGNGPILAEAPIMHTIGLITLRPKPVNARSFYARLTPEPPRRTGHRLALTRFVTGERPTPSREQVRRALSALRVDLVCVDESKRLVIREVETIAPFREAFRARSLVCLRREQSVAAAAGRRGRSTGVQVATPLRQPTRVRGYAL